MEEDGEAAGTVEGAPEARTGSLGLEDPGLLAAPVYCVCRRPDINCFMIGCDKCNEWFHGDCIQITEKMAKGIRQWYCRQCRANDATLAIKYRQKKAREKEGDGEAMPEREKRKEQVEARMERRKVTVNVSPSSLPSPHSSGTGAPSPFKRCSSILPES
ncbi:CXXC-type zinc finger protein 1-like isoform X2 [Narcine bancroftii]|uniref:CXXC-type zinc finger protein 1-like isoform X2 n=1 Tax=Narcine bancroftii TaxID=1343680 RepID=UPI003830FEF9